MEAEALYMEAQAPLGMVHTHSVDSDWSSFLRGCQPKSFVVRATKGQEKELRRSNGSKEISCMVVGSVPSCTLGVYHKLFGTVVTNIATILMVTMH